MFKLSLYFYTLKYMKPSQIFCRIRKIAGLKCRIGCGVKKFCQEEVNPVVSIPELDYDPAFLSRFSADEILQDKITFLHSSRKFQWRGAWECKDQTALWNFNLHYFEYLFVLVRAYRQTGKTDYYVKTKECISNWIENNPESAGGAGWSAYTISLRLTNWLSYYWEMQEEIRKDAGFCLCFLKSVYGQYVYLASHLEKDLLGNHYFEDLKALILCALFFQDEKMLAKAVGGFKSQCKEQILKDGMHFELSPMYHKIIFEDMLRIAHAMREAGQPDKEIEAYLQPMLDVAFSLERGLERAPLFNDGGNNVAKSLNALLMAAENHFNLIPKIKTKFQDSGYYIFNEEGWTLIVDAGQPGPAYIPGHAHCDAMSFELFKDGKPVVSNCGTYAYQCEERSFFRSTQAHNTVMVNETEQSQCWGAFRLAKRASVMVLDISNDSISMEMTDQKRQKIKRKIVMRNGQMIIRDESEGRNLKEFIHFIGETSQKSKSDDFLNIHGGSYQKRKQLYAPEYGMLLEMTEIEISGKSKIEAVIDLKRLGGYS